MHAAPLAVAALKQVAPLSRRRFLDRDARVRDRRPDSGRPRARRRDATIVLCRFRQFNHLNSHPIYLPIDTSRTQV